jgi:hypothetical protein
MRVRPTLSTATAFLNNYTSDDLQILIFLHKLSAIDLSVCAKSQGLNCSVAKVVDLD